MGTNPAYTSSVFINCPFDADYRRLFEAVVFTVHDCGFMARSALEVADSGQVRIEKISGLIADCRLGLHDLSRTELDPLHGLPRFNMPLELGIFLGAKWLGSPRHRKKLCLVLDRERYRYQKFCSDISGQDVAAHAGDPRLVIREVRHWLRSVSPDILIPGPTRIWERFRQFVEDFPVYCDVFALDEDDLSFRDLISVISAWQFENEW